MHQYGNRPDDLDLGASSLSLSSVSSSSGGYLNGTIDSVTNDNFRLDYLEERAVRGNNRGNFDEIDLVSECSTPCTYTPGKYLQLCDISPSDIHEVTLWPFGASSGAPPAEWDTVPLVVPHKKHFEKGSLLQSYKIPLPDHHCRSARCLSNKILVVVAVCLIIALSALGGVAVVI